MVLYPADTVTFPNRSRRASWSERSQNAPSRDRPRCLPGACTRGRGKAGARGARKGAPRSRAPCCGEAKSAWERLARSKKTEIFGKKEKKPQPSKSRHTSMKRFFTPAAGSSDGKRAKGDDVNDTAATTATTTSETPCTKSPKTFMTWNCNSLLGRLRKESDKAAFARYVVRNDPDVIALQETWLPAAGPERYVVACCVCTRLSRAFVSMCGSTHVRTVWPSSCVFASNIVGTRKYGRAQ
jgi:hypothetical protein